MMGGNLTVARLDENVTVVRHGMECDGFEMWAGMQWLSDAAHLSKA